MIGVVSEVEFMSRTLFSARAGRLSLWLGGAALALVVFVRITRELIEGDAGAMDSAILLAVAKSRTPWLTITAVDVTALGSITLVVLFSAFTLLVLLVLRDRMGALQLLAASSGSRNTDNRDQRHHRKKSSSRGSTVDRSVGLLIPERTFGFNLRALLDDRDHRVAVIYSTRAQEPQFSWPCRRCSSWLAPHACTLAFIMRLTS